MLFRQGVIVETEVGVAEGELERPLDSRLIGEARVEGVCRTPEHLTHSGVVRAPGTAQIRRTKQVIGDEAVDGLVLACSQLRLSRGLLGVTVRLSLVSIEEQTCDQ